MPIVRRYLIGEDIQQPQLSGEKMNIACKVCGFQLGAIPKEVIEALGSDYVMAEIGPVLDYHMRKEHGIENGGRDAD